MSDKYQPVIGLEIHIELSTNSKMFCGCPADHFGKSPNTQTCPVCLGLPGALPVTNARAIEWTIKMGLALNCEINLHSKFDRKNYFYPDIPKGFQISQYDLPFCYTGLLEINDKKIHISRVHLEEDTGKLQHVAVNGQEASLIDFNRSGVALIEIVTEPDFSNAQEAVEFSREIQLIVRKLGISTADMEKGSMRLEANVSLRPQNQKELPPYKIELKNINSFAFLKKAIEYDLKRQEEILTSGQTPVQETRGFVESKGQTKSQRSKENANDYRYFSEPDIPPISLSQMQIEIWKKELPELPSQVRTRLVTHGISQAAAITLSANLEHLKLFEEASQIDPSQMSNIANILVNKRYGDTLPKTGRDLLNIIKSRVVLPVNELLLQQVIDEILSNNSDAVIAYKSGKSQALGFLLGEAMKKLKGKADPSQLRLALLSKLN